MNNHDISISADALSVFIPLLFSIVVIWILPKSLRYGRLLAFWLLPFSLSIVAALVTEMVSIEAGIFAMCFLALGIGATDRSLNKLVKNSCVITIGVLSLALATHQLPGFTRVSVVDNVILGSSHLHYNLVLSLDTGVCAVVLSLFFAQGMNSLQQWITIIKRSSLTILFTIGLVFSLAVIFGLRPDYKLGLLTPLHLIINLLFTCIIEEAFFRGLIQGNLSRIFIRKRYGSSIALTITSITFGLVHLPHGEEFAFLAIIAGFGYGLVYQKTKGIEGSVICHFLVNAILFIFFVYPPTF